MELPTIDTITDIVSSDLALNVSSIVEYLYSIAILLAITLGFLLGRSLGE